MSQRRHRHNRQASVDYPRYPPMKSTTQQPPFDPTQQQVAVSDYESDHPGYTSDYPTQLPPAHRNKEDLNFTVINRHFPHVAEVKVVASAATVYEFISNEWQKTGVNGSLFICELVDGPLGEKRFAAIVLNKNGLENFEMELKGTDSNIVTFEDPFVILTTEKAGVQTAYGIFIYSGDPGSNTENERSATAQLMVTLSQIAAQSEETARLLNSRTSQPAPVPDPPASNGGGIVLSSPQDPNSAASINSHLQDMLRMMHGNPA